MQFIDLKELKAHKVYDYDTVPMYFDANKLLDSPAKDVKEYIFAYMSIWTRKEDGAVLFSIELSHAKDVDDFNCLVEIIVDNIMAYLTLDEKRDREARLGAPKNLKEIVNCNQVPLMKMINNKTKTDMFAIRIEDTEKGWIYDSVSRQ